MDMDMDMATFTELLEELLSTAFPLASLPVVEGEPLPFTPEEIGILGELACRIDEALQVLWEQPAGSLAVAALLNATEALIINRFPLEEAFNPWAYAVNADDMEAVRAALENYVGVTA